MPSWFRAMRAGARVQASRSRGSVYLLASIITPVAYAVVFMLMARYLGRTDIAAYVVIAPALMGVWYSAIALGAAVVADDRGVGTLELIVASPAPAVLVILGRVAMSTVLSLISVPLVLVPGRILGFELVVTEPLIGLIGLVSLGLSTIAASLVFASTFVLARRIAVLQNLIPFPLYILSGIAFPLTLLPEWLRPLSTLIPLTWVADILRASTRTADAGAVLPAVGAVSVLAVVYAAFGLWLFTRIERAIRASGEVSLTS